MKKILGGILALSLFTSPIIAPAIVEGKFPQKSKIEYATPEQVETERREGEDYLKQREIDKEEATKKQIEYRKEAEKLLPKPEDFHVPLQEKQKRNLKVRENVESLENRVESTNLRGVLFKPEIEEAIERGYELASQEVNIPLYIDLRFVKAVAWIESKGDPKGKGKNGERGLMQLKEEAWQEVEPELSYWKHCYDPEINPKTGTKYLVGIDEDGRKTYNRWDKLSVNEKRELIAAGYNAGPTTLIKNNWQISRVPDKTKNYLEKLRMHLN